MCNINKHHEESLVETGTGQDPALDFAGLFSTGSVQQKLGKILSANQQKAFCRSSL